MGTGNPDGLLDYHNHLLNIDNTEFGLPVTIANTEEGTVHQI